MVLINYTDCNRITLEPRNEVEERLLAALYAVIADGGSIRVSPNDSQEPIDVTYTKPGQRTELK
jgi:hypothetical protein